ncbi:hypothetical protein LzC2_36800 [Planctomycetes bacterium LzC2]|uniref:Uncharacterized protein n=1 Tax=Alienimonas chondri TaxID=2681879 RepID=A0ABX1VJ62_9PLAN|nr:hypothetical protein [Alienimonas chondri]
MGGLLVDEDRHTIKNRPRTHAAFGGGSLSSELTRGSTQNSLITSPAARVPKAPQVP